MVLEKLIFGIVAVLSFSTGVFIYMKPQRAFEIQQAFYACINWRIEPIDWQKEMRNTKILGMILTVFTIVCCFYQFTH